MGMDRDELAKRIQLEMVHHIGKTNGLDRWWLVQKLFGPGAEIPKTDDNIYDRRIRRTIEILRRKGALICNLGDGRGWFLAGSAEEYQAFRASYGSHAFPIMETIHEMDKTAQREWPNALQPRLI